MVIISIFGLLIPSPFVYSQLSYTSEDYDIESIWTYTTDEASLYHVKLGEDGKYLVATGQNESLFLNEPSDGRIYLFDANSNIPLWTNNDTERIRDLDCSDNIEYFVVGDNGNFTYLFSRSGSTPLWSFDMEYPVTDVAISSDGELFVAGSANGTLIFCNRSETQPVWKCQLGAAFKSLAISDNGNYICAGLNFKGIYLFHKDSSVPEWRNLTLETQNYADISADGQKIAAAYGGNVSLFDRSSPQPLWTEEITDRIAKDIKISKDGSSIVCSSSDTNYGVTHYDASIGNYKWKYHESTYRCVLSESGDFTLARGTEYALLFKDDSSNPIQRYLFMSEHPGYQSVDIDLDSEADKMVFLSVDQPSSSLIEIFSIKEKGDEKDSSDDNGDDTTGPTVSLTLIPVLAAALGIAYLILTKKSQLKA